MAVRPMVIAHRGASGYFPEHSPSAYRLALQQGADALEPDIVVSADGVLVVRHENELSATTDVAKHVQFAHRYTSRVIDGTVVTGWFTEDFTWEELQLLRCVEPRPRIRPESAKHNGTESIMRLADVLQLVDKTSSKTNVVVEIKHPTYYNLIGRPFVPLIERELAVAGWKPSDQRLIFESFEKSILASLKTAGIGKMHVYLCEFHGIAADEAASRPSGLTYSQELGPTGLALLASQVDGISVDVRYLLSGAPLVADPMERLAQAGFTPQLTLVDRAHELGLSVFTWTLRPENKFLPQSLREGVNPAGWGDWQTFYMGVLNTGVDGVFVDHPDLMSQLAVATRP